MGNLPFHLAAAAWRRFVLEELARYEKESVASGVTAAGSSAFWGLPHLSGDSLRGRGQYLTPHGYLLLSSLELSLSLSLSSLPFLSLSLVIPAVCSFLSSGWDRSPSVLCTHDVLLKSLEFRLGKKSFN